VSDKPKYTEKIHAERLLCMLEMSEPCTRCPARKDIGLDREDLDEHWDTVRINYVPWWSLCYDVCLPFIGGGWNCPCLALGHHEAIKRTWLALEAKEYLD
jgi:hypothetical protein